MRVCGWELLPLGTSGLPGDGESEGDGMTPPGLQKEVSECRSGFPHLDQSHHPGTPRKPPTQISVPTPWGLVVATPQV